MTRRSTASSTPSAAGPPPTATNSSDEHIYIDEGYSGSRLDRPALDRLRDAAREGEFDVVAVYSPDRLARRYAYQVLLLEEFRRAGCDVEFVERPISDDPHDQLLLQIQGAIAEYERAVLGERFRRGKLQKARAGHWVAGQAPYGYRYVPARDGVPAHLEIEEAEAEVVRMLYRWLIDERMTVRQILKRLAAGPWRPRNGKRLWSNSVVHRILSDPVYTGTAYANRHVFVVPRKPRSTGPRAGTPTCRKPRPREEWIPIPVPAIIDEVDASRREGATGPQLGPVVPEQHPQRVPAPLPADLPGCGLAMFGVTTYGKPGQAVHRYYKCHGKDTVARDRACRCPQTPAKVEELDAAVWDHVKPLLDDPATLAAQFEELARQPAIDGRRPRRGPEVGGPAPAARPRGAAAARRLPGRGDRPGRAEGPPRADPGPPRRSWRPSATRSNGCGRAAGGEGGLVGPEAFCQRVRSRLDEATLAERQRILQLLIERVIVGEDSLEIRHVIPLGRRAGSRQAPARRGPRAGRRGGTRTRGGARPPADLSIAFGWCAPSRKPARHRPASPGPWPCKPSSGRPSHHLGLGREMALGYLVASAGIQAKDHRVLAQKDPQPPAMTLLPSSSMKTIQRVSSACAKADWALRPAELRRWAETTVRGAPDRRPPCPVPSPDQATATGPATAP